MFDKQQFENLISETLADYGLESPAALNLLLGTAAQESRFGTYLRQLGGGPALGIFQMEPATYRWMQEKYGEKYGFSKRPATDMIWDLRLAVLLARLRYLVVPEKLPPAGDRDALAAYWKKYYNTVKGAGTENEFLINYAKYVKKEL